MADSAYTIEWLGFNEKPNYNRIWGHLHMNDGRDYVFWGMRGSKIEFKQHMQKYKIPSIINQNKKKGYKSIETSHYELLCPNFIQDMEVSFMAYILKNS